MAGFHFHHLPYGYGSGVLQAGLAATGLCFYCAIDRCFLPGISSCPINESELHFLARIEKFLMHAARKVREQGKEPVSDVLRCALNEEEPDPEG